jgi:Protein of unknown function (DUF3987)
MHVFPEPSLKDFQSHGYTEVYARNNEHFEDDPFVFVPTTIGEMESAYSSASPDDNGDLRIRGLLYEVDFSPSDLRYKATAFRPDANGEEFYVEPVYEDGRIIDLIWSTADDWGFTTGRGAVLGTENLMKTYTAELPLHVYSDPHRYWEHLDDEDLGKEDAVCILKPSARALLPAVGHVQVFWWDDVEELAEGFFAGCVERVSAFQDQEAFDAFVKRAALWERFDNMQAPTLTAGPRLTWAHAKAAVKARRKTNAETGLDGFEEFRARVRAHAARPEVRGAIDAWYELPSDENRLLAQNACMPFYLMDVIIGRMTPLVSFGEWKRRQENAGTATDIELSGAATGDEPVGGKVSRKAAEADPLDAITLGRSVDWTRPDGVLGEVAEWILQTAQSPNRPLAVAAADATLAAVAGRANLYGPTFSALSVYTVMLGRTTIGKDRALKAVEQILRAAQLGTLCAGDGYSLSAMEAMLAESPAVIMTVDEIAKNLFPRMLGGKANSHETAILGFLLKLFTRNMGDPPYTSTRRSPKSIVQHVSVDSPQFSLLGASTPEGFYEALQAGNLDDGFMNRLIVVEAAPRTSNNAVRAANVPKSICDALQAIVLAGRKSDPLARALRPAERLVPWASDAVKIEWRRLRDQVHAIIDAVRTKEGSLYGRIAEQTVRFAARHALSRDGASAAVNMADLEWGAAFVRQSVRTMRP